jgi:hypothetical protein
MVDDLRIGFWRQDAAVNLEVPGFGKKLRPR